MHPHSEAEPHREAGRNVQGRPAELRGQSEVKRVEIG